MVSTKSTVRVQRIYEGSDSQDGLRILVDRIWPRGMTRTAARLDEWCKQIAPSTELRTWYKHEPALFTEFVDRYQVELQAPERAAALDHLRALAENHTLTLLTATKRIDISHAQVITDLLHA
ncbi:MAG: DUF488 family protein [Candidatus Nanopelagicales bacterium]